MSPLIREEITETIEGMESIPCWTCGKDIRTAKQLLECRKHYVADIRELEAELVQLKAEVADGIVDRLLVIKERDKFKAENAKLLKLFQENAQVYSELARANNAGIEVVGENIRLKAENANLRAAIEKHLECGFLERRCDWQSLKDVLAECAPGKEPKP